jgi:hypothetical protein
MEYVRGEVKKRWLVEAIDPDGIEGFGHVEEDRACQPLFAEVPGYSFNEAGQLQGRAVPGSESKLLVSHQTALTYYM